MIKRFQIEDLIVQDSSGVVFRALDTHTGKMVAVRRFFPFGVDGGGLHAEEQAAYNIALNRLSGLNHPSLRSVVCGGCDPVDGMPYIATEWIEGEALEPLLADHALSAESAVVLITQALEVSELLSHVLAEEAVWVETELCTIVVGSPESGRGFTFWISPLKWLGGRGENRGLESIVTLTEEVMDWKGRIVSDQAGRGLGGWLKWLRGASATTSLHEVRESLAASVGAEPPAPATNLVAKATTGPLARPSKPRSSKAPLFASLAALIAVASIGVWIWKRKHAIETGEFLPVPPAVTAEAAPPPTVGETPPKPQPKPRPVPVVPSPNDPQDSGLERANRGSAELSAKAVDDKEQAALIPWDQHDLLVRNDGKPVVVEGVVLDIVNSKSGGVVYLLFSGNSDRNAARAAIVVPVAEVEAMKKKFNPFRGQKVRVAGTVRHVTVKGLSRPDIIMIDSSAVSLGH